MPLKTSLKRLLWIPRCKRSGIILVFCTKNAANPRKLWLPMRRYLSWIAMMGTHKNAFLPSKVHIINTKCKRTLTSLNRWSIQDSSFQTH
jgi:hypothetical protein